MYHVDRLADDDPDKPAVDAVAHEQTWNDMLRLQAHGVYPAAFAAITSPVLMLHGAYDPHPGERIAASLRSYVKDFTYHQWDHCGHDPFAERTVQSDCFARITAWLTSHRTTP